MRQVADTAFIERCRRPDGTVRPIVIAQAVAKNTNGSLREHLRMRKDQWLEADALDGFDFLPEGDVRLHDTISTVIQSTTHPNNFTDLNRDFPLTTGMVEWGGTESADIEIRRVSAWLNPRVSLSQSRNVVQWKLELLQLVETGFPAGIPARRQLLLAPLCDPLTVPCNGDAAGVVVFDYAQSHIIQKPTPKKLSPYQLELTPVLFNTGPVPTTYILITAWQADGSPASNVALGYDAGVPTVNTGGNILSGRTLIAPIAGPLDLFQGFTHRDDGAAAGTPHIVIDSGTYTSATLTFAVGVNRNRTKSSGLAIPAPPVSGFSATTPLTQTPGAGLFGGGSFLLPSWGTNQFDLGGTPTADVIFTITGSIPTGTSLIGQVLKDNGDPLVDGDWVTFTSGQKSTDLANVGKRQLYAMRAKLLTNAAFTLTPTLISLGVQEVTETDLRNVATVSGGDWSIDPRTLKGEIPEITITAIRDGARDYFDAMTDLLANNHIGNLVFRVYWGDSVLTRSQWLHIDDFLVDGSHPRAADLSLKCLSVLCLLRDMVPRYEPGETLYPNGDVSVGAWTTDGGGTVDLYQRINESAFDDTTYARSEVNPTNSSYTVKLAQPADPVGRAHILEYRYEKDSTDTMDLTVQWMVGNTVIATLPHSNIPQEPTAGSFSLTDAQIAAITDYADMRIRFTANKVSGGGSTRVRVSWARMRWGGKRDEVGYLNSSLKATYDDLLKNQLALDARYIGPGVSDEVTTVSKTISEPQRNGKPTSKGEVDAIAAIAGGGVISSQGRIQFKELYGTRAVRAIFPSEEIRMDSAGPGYEDRVPEFYVLYRWNAALGDFEGEARSFHAGALLNLGKSRLGGIQFLDEVISRWIDTETLANTVGNRQTVAIGPGIIEWSFTSIYPYPELEPGDGVLVQTDQFVARDPNVARALRGVLWVFGVVRSVDVSARRFRVWIRNYADIFPSNENVVRDVLASQDPTVTVSAHSLYALRKLYIVYMGGSGTQSVRIARSNTVPPASGQGTAYDGQSGTQDTGAIDYNVDTYVTVTPYPQLGGVGFPGASITFKANAGIIKPQLINTGTGQIESDEDIFVISTKTLRIGTVASPGSLTKTLRLASGEVVPLSDTVTWVFDSASGYLRGNSLNAESFRAAVLLPKGVTVTTFRARLYRQNDPADEAFAQLARVNSDDSVTTITTATHSGTGWQTISQSISQLVGDESYYLVITLNPGAAGTASDTRFHWAEFEYTVPSYDKGV